MLLRLSPALVLLLASGCAQMPFTGYGTSSEYTEAELRDDLTDFVGRFSATVTGAAEDISARTHSRTVRRRSLLWRLRVIPLMHDLAFQDDPRSAFVDILGVTTSMKLYLVEGDGRESFGESQPLATIRPWRSARDSSTPGRWSGSRRRSSGSPAGTPSADRTSPSAPSRAHWRWPTR